MMPLKSFMGWLVSPYSMPSSCSSPSSSQPEQPNQIVIGRLWFAVALLIVMVSFSFKVLYYTGAPDALMKVGQKRLNEFFQDHRFVLAGTVDLAPEPRSLTFTTFIGPSCDKAIRAAALSSDLSADQMAA